MCKIWRGFSRETARGIVRGNAIMIEWRIGLAGILREWVRRISNGFRENLEWIF